MIRWNHRTRQTNNRAKRKINTEFSHFSLCLSMRLSSLPGSGSLFALVVPVVVVAFVGDCCCNPELRVAQGAHTSLRKGTVLFSTLDSLLLHLSKAHNIIFVCRTMDDNTNYHSFSSRADWFQIISFASASSLSIILVLLLGVRINFPVAVFLLFLFGILNGCSHTKFDIHTDTNIVEPVYIFT